MRHTKRLLSLVLVVLMLLGCLPGAVFAADTGTKYEAEAMTVTPSGNWGIKEKRSTSDAACSGKYFYFLQGSNGQYEMTWEQVKNNAAAFDLGDVPAGTYRVYLFTKDNVDRGIFQFSVGGQNLGAPLDMYLAKADYTGEYGSYVEHDLGTVTHSGGTFTLDAKLTGQNDAATSRYGMVLDYVRLVEEAPVETKLEGEDAAVTKAGSWSISNPIRDDAPASGGKFYFNQDGDPGDTLTFAWNETLTAGTYRVFLITKDNKDRGIYQFTLGDQPIGTPEDFFVAETDYTASYGSYVEHDLGTVSFDGGPLTLKAAVTGSSPEATGKNGIALDYVRLVRTGDAVTADPIHMTLTDDGVTKSAGWNDSSLKGSTADASSVYAGTVGAYVQFQPQNLEAGWYSVQFWNIASGQNPMKMTAEIKADGAVETVQPKTMTTDGWNNLGAYYFSGDGSEYLKLTITTAGSHSRVADVRFVPVADPGYETEIWNNEDSCFSSSGSWTTADAVGQNGSAAHTTTDTEALATWAAYPPKTGNFSLYYWNPAQQDGETRAPLRFSVSSQDGNWRFSLDASKNPGGWVKVGTVAATEGTMLTVSMSLTGEGIAYADALKLAETAASPDPVYTPGAGGSDEPAVIVNQIGYDLGASKRATAVNIPGGTEFRVINTDTGETAFTGTVEEAYGGEGDSAVTGGILDFTALEPETTTEYYIECAGAESYRFEIGKNLMFQQTVNQAVQFMEETRQDYKVGASTGYGWRDSHQFSFELNSMVLQYMANPAAYDNMTGGITDAAKCTYEELCTQLEGEPDLVWLIKFGALRYYDLGANDSVKLHMLIKEQLAYFLYLYPEIQQWVDPVLGEDFYEKVRDYTIEQWGVNSCNKQWYPVSGTNHDLYALQTAFGGLKGSQPPGHSIMPNLMMYEVALRDGLGDDVAKKFFDAAYDNAAYLIGDDFDLTDPYYNKGQRMSEHITMTGLAYFLEMYPEKAPQGLQAAIVEWAEANVARTDNLWDIRMAVAPSDLDRGYTYHTGSNKGKPVNTIYWTGAAYAIADGQNPAPKNEPGNQAGLQAIAYAAARVIDDEALQAQLKTMGVSAIDDLFGRNPTGRAAFYDLTRDFPGGDLGWWTQPTGGYGALHQCTAVIDANAPESTYPYVPENYNTGYTEGWVAYNTAWNDSLAYSSAAATALTVDKAEAAVGDTITVTLDAPVNLNPDQVETAYVWVQADGGAATKLTLTENAADGTAFTGTYTPAAAGTVTFSYGIGLFEQQAQVTVKTEDHTHSGSEVLGKAPTCTEAGIKTYYVCSCDKAFEDKACTKEILNLDDWKVVPALGHDWETAWAQSETAYWHECSRCDAVCDRAAHVEVLVGYVKPTLWKEGYSGDLCCEVCCRLLEKGETLPALLEDVVLPGLPETPDWQLPFTDVPEGAWYFESVYYAWDEDLIDGVTADQYQPDGSLTVAQAIKLAAALHENLNRGYVTLENGVVNWYDTYVDYAVNNGIIEGKYRSYSKAQMDAAITRSEFVHIFHGAMDTYKAINDVKDNAIPDVKMQDAYADEIYDFYRAGILTGSDGAGTFHGVSTIKRSEVAAILIRMFDEDFHQSIRL